MKKWNELVYVKRVCFETGRELNYRDSSRVDDLMTIFIPDIYINDDDIVINDFFGYEFFPRPGSYLYDLYKEDRDLAFGDDISEIEKQLNLRNIGEDGCYLVYEMFWNGEEDCEPEWELSGVLDMESVRVYF